MQVTTTATTGTVYASYWNTITRDDDSDCRTIGELRARHKELMARRNELWRTEVYPWMSDFTEVLDYLQLCCRPIRMDLEEEWRPTLKKYIKKGWEPICMTQYSRIERLAITRELKLCRGKTWTSRPMRSQDKFAIVHLVNEPEIIIMFEDPVDRARLLLWLKNRFPRPSVLFTAKPELPVEVRRMLRGKNHYVLRGSQGAVISAEAMPTEKLKEIQALL